MVIKEQFPGAWWICPHEVSSPWAARSSHTADGGQSDWSMISGVQDSRDGDRTRLAEWILPVSVWVSATDGPAGRAFRGENGVSCCSRWVINDFACSRGGRCSRITAGGPLTPVNCDRVRSCLSRVGRVALWALQCRFEHADQISFVPSGPRGPPLVV
jgi:hypothetical protein